MWKSDGTDAGTVMIKDITPNGGGSYPSQLVAGLSRVYFVARDSSYTYGLYETNGTDVANLLQFDTATVDFNYINNLKYLDGKLYFTAETVEAGTELWVFDIGTSTINVNKLEDTTPFASLYPNPNNGQFVLNIEDAQDLNMRILNVVGKVLKEGQLRGAEIHNINVEAFPQGVYFVHLFNGTKKQIIKFVKQ